MPEQIFSAQQMNKPLMVRLTMASLITLNYFF